MATLIRLLIWGLLNRMGRRMSQGGGAPPWRTPGQAGHPAPPWGLRWRGGRQWWAKLTDNARVLARVMAIVVFLLAFALLLSAGVTVTVLGPLWVGITFLALATLTLAVVVLESRALNHHVATRRRTARQVERDKQPPV